jgi:hypothetical protein
MIAASRAICRSPNTSPREATQSKASIRSIACPRVTAVENEADMTAYLISLALAGLTAIALCEAFE